MIFSLIHEQEKLNVRKVVMNLFEQREKNMGKQKREKITKGEIIKNKGQKWQRVFYNNYWKKKKKREIKGEKIKRGRERATKNLSRFFLVLHCVSPNVLMVI